MHTKLQYMYINTYMHTHTCCSRPSVPPAPAHCDHRVFFLLYTLRMGCLCSQVIVKVLMQFNICQLVHGFYDTATKTKLLILFVLE